MLDAAYTNVPQPSDAEKYAQALSIWMEADLDFIRPKYYIPKQPYATPSYYPQQPALSLETPHLFAKLGNDTLFYIFYYHQGTYAQ